MQTPRLHLPFLIENQARKHVTLNESLAALDALIHCRVLSRTLEAQPEAPADGDAYLLVDDPAGDAWSLMTPGSVAVFLGGWRELSPPLGMCLFVADESLLLVRGEGGWTALDETIRELALDRLALGRAPLDPDLALSARLNTALFSAPDSPAPGDVRLVLDRRTSEAVASLLFQTDYEGQAEICLTDGGRLRVRAASEPEVWRDVLVADPQGRVGVNLSAPAAALDIQTTDVSAPTVQAAIYAESSAGINVTGAKSRGTPEAPGGALAGDRLLGFYGRAQHSGGALSGNAVAFQLIAEETFTATAHGTAISFETTPLGSVARRTTVRFQPNGALRLMPLSSPPDAPQAGEVYFDSTLSAFRGFDGAAWVALG
ncbi:DUF2793 domain-containing protein [Brevundimonas sp. 2R-24]|uniref:DUF2793 domain-containing protein n=1 Tax=Peiella sedimenti TaxID=3061083 RepID=A0ABT8SM26_9CAUL|nr:DUF2793 domain-containing protein [Caulobacteraceae bacterium XZ-24]